MIKNYRIVLLLIMFIVLFGCNNSKSPDIMSSFTRPFPRLTKRLQIKLGGTFSIKKGNDTITFLVDFRNSDRYNFIIEEKTKDTIFQGTVCKYKGLYYLNHQLNDTTCWIHAIEINKETIKGLKTERLQMLGWDKHLEVWLTEKDPEKIKTKPSFIKCTDPEKGIIRLIPMKKELAKFYSAVIDTIPPDTFLFLEEPTIESKIINEIANIQERLTEKLEFISKVYPNPANDYCNIEFENIGSYKFGIYDELGKLLMIGKFEDKVNEIDLSKLSAGIHYLLVQSEKSDHVETVKLLVE